LAPAGGAALARGATNGPLSNSGYRNFANVLWHLIAPLHGGGPCGNTVPALHVCIGVEIDSLPFVSRDPWPDGDVGDGVGVGDEFVLGEPAVEHAVEPMRLLEIPLFRVGRLTLVVFHKVMDLAEHRAGSAHLPHQPFEHAIVPLA